jgi:uncharacterized protein (TIGR01777 family)
MHIVVTGGTGFIGGALLPALIDRGDRVTVLTRQSRLQTAGSENLRYVTALDAIEAPVDVVVNLAGASLAARRWTAAYKREIRASRVDFTQTLVAWMKSLDTPPAALISGSAIGYYGASLDARFTESSAVASDFAATLCRDWERAALGAHSDATRVVLLRLGVVMDAGGGALTEMMRSFQFGVGSWLGSGRQWLSWIHRKDVIRVIVAALDAEITGPINVVAPTPVTHRSFCDAVARKRRTLFSAGVPGFVMRGLLGEMADALLLTGQRVEPERLQTEMGFNFSYPTIDDALGDILG